MEFLLATIDSDAPALAECRNLGLELDEFCTAVNMDEPDLFAPRDAAIQGYGTLPRVLHLPYNELFPCAIDPLVRAVAKKRLDQACALGRHYGLRRFVAHGNYVPNVYFPVWYVEQAIGFWKDFLSDKPRDFVLYLENVLEPEPELLRDIVAGVDDPRCRLCLDLGHANVAAVSDVPPLRWLEVCAPYLGHLHLHNNDRSWDWHRPLGGGSIPMEEVMAFLTAETPEVSITLEHAEQSEQSLLWLAERGYLNKV